MSVARLTPLYVISSSSSYICIKKVKWGCADTDVKRVKCRCYR